MDDTPVHFYDLDKPYGEFGNFYRAPVELDGQIWLTSEHYFQAQKFIHHEEQYKHILEAPSPRKAFDYARSHDSLKRSNWNGVKNDVMLKACMAKFQQHPHLKELLLSTDNRTLAEHTVNDSYWGDGGDRSGRNQLGITLMKVRDLFHHHH
ncbi:unnamed protein product [Adineta steineri]|uniref:NADAR domain-containing protein n=1 Tax=Adineta steineri TaxID=433720 RepID=A0A818ZYP7_9BILA|nr:unnamed protein product [Adineta steineri]CAF3774283.1 unnamed protein product [Adineta steineri]